MYLAQYSNTLVLPESLFGYIINLQQHQLDPKSFMYFIF